MKPTEHTCKYCGCLTTQPDSDCYAKPKNTMEHHNKKDIDRIRQEKDFKDQLKTIAKLLVILIVGIIVMTFFRS